MGGSHGGDRPRRRNGGARLIPDLQKAEAAILHEMGAMLTSVHGFADILVRLPEHPDGKRFISMVASEARRSVDALRDLQLVRALIAGDLREHLELVDMGEIARGAGIEGAGRLDDVKVNADRSLLAEILTRCAAIAPGLARVDGRSSSLVIPLGDVTIEELESWRERLRPVALAMHVFPRWELDLKIDDASDVHLLVAIRR